MINVRPFQLKMFCDYMHEMQFAKWWNYNKKQSNSNRSLRAAPG